VYIIPPVSPRKLGSQNEIVGAKETEEEVVDGEIVDFVFSSNGKGQREEEQAWKECNR
jgi:hypothetical protein